MMTLSCLWLPGGTIDRSSERFFYLISHRRSAAPGRANSGQLSHFILILLSYLIFAADFFIYVGFWFCDMQRGLDQLAMIVLPFACFR